MYANRSLSYQIDHPYTCVYVSYFIVSFLKVLLIYQRAITAYRKQLQIQDNDIIVTIHLEPKLNE